MLTMHVDGRNIDVALLHPVGQRQVIHRLMNAAQFATRDRQVARLCRAARQHDRVVRGQQDLDVDAITDGRVRAELGALSFHLGDTPRQVSLLHLELGNAIAQQPANSSARSKTTVSWPAGVNC